MRAKDIKPGVVYAYRPPGRSSVEPIVFLAEATTDNLYCYDRYATPGQPCFKHRPDVQKPSQGSGFRADIGYPAVTIRTVGGSIADLQQVTLRDFLSATERANVESDYEFRVITTMARVIGPYQDTEEK